MNKLQATGIWNIAKGKLKQRLAHFMDDELQFNEGREEELIGRIQRRSGQTREKTAGLVSECCSGSCRALKSM